MDVRGGLRLRADAFRDVGDGSAGAELLDEVIRLGCERLVDLFRAPLSLDFRFRFVEAAVVRRVDLGDREPDEAVVLGLQRRLVEADVGREGRAQKIGLVGQAHRLAVRIQALRVDRRDRLRRQPGVLRRLREGLAGDARILDLVVDGLNLVALRGTPRPAA